MCLNVISYPVSANLSRSSLLHGCKTLFHMWLQEDSFLRLFSLHRFGWKDSSPPYFNGFPLIQGLAFCKGHLAQFEYKAEKTSDMEATYFKVHNPRRSLDHGITMEWPAV